MLLKIQLRELLFRRIQPIYTPNSGAGQKIYFRVDGLYIGEFAGLPTIGIREFRSRTNGIPDFENRILRSTEKVEIVPTVITMNQLGDPSKLATLIKLEGVQFTDDLIGRTTETLTYL